jgi:hypothetical protein
MTQFQGDIKIVYSELFEKTLNWLKDNGFNFHQLVMGKIHYDLLIDEIVDWRILFLSVVARYAQCSWRMWTVWCRIMIASRLLSLVGRVGGCRRCC